MSLLSLPGGFICPSPPPFALAAPGLATAGMSSANHKVSFAFRAPKDGTIDWFEVRQNANSTSPTGGGVRFAFQGLDSSGLADGVNIAYRDKTTGFAANTWQTPPGVMTSDGTNGGTKLTVTKGDWICAVLYFPSYVAGNITWSLFDLTTSSNIAMPNFNYSAVFNTSWVKNNNTLVMALKYDDGSYPPILCDVYPVMTVNSVTFSSASSPSERGLYFSIPANCYLGGAWIRIDLDGNADAVLYDTDGTTVLQTVTMLTANRFSTSGATGYVPFNDIPLAAGGNYRLVVKPGASSVTVYDFDINSAGLMAAVPGGANWIYTQKASGVWSQTSTKRPWMGLQLNGISSIPVGAEVSYVG